MHLLRMKSEQLIDENLPTTANIGYCGVGPTKLMRFNLQLKSYFAVNFPKIRQVEIISLAPLFEMISQPLTDVSNRTFEQIKGRQGGVRVESIRKQGFLIEAHL